MTSKASLGYSWTSTLSRQSPSVDCLLRVETATVTNLISGEGAAGAASRAVG
jgi:hypothetical protein